MNYSILLCARFYAEFYNPLFTLIVNEGSNLIVFLNEFIYLFLAALGLCCCVGFL